MKWKYWFSRGNGTALGQATAALKILGASLEHALPFDQNLEASASCGRVGKSEDCDINLAQVRKLQISWIYSEKDSFIYTKNKKKFLEFQETEHKKVVFIRSSENCLGTIFPAEWQDSTSNFLSIADRFFKTR